MRSNLLFLLPVSFLLMLGPIGRSGADPESVDRSEAFERASAASEIGGYALSKVHRWLHEVALKHVDEETGLLKARGEWNYANTAADVYPFVCWAAYATDPAVLNGAMRDLLRNEQQLCNHLDRIPAPYDFDQGRKFKKHPRQKLIFGASEYLKDGLVPIVEVTGRGSWLKRMKELTNDLWAHANVDTPYGRIPSMDDQRRADEVNGEQLQVLCRLYAMTGEEKYLDWAERIGDLYLLRDDYVPQYLRDHGCEIIGGLGLLLAVESHADPEKFEQYRKPMRHMFDQILRRGTNGDGFMFNRLRESPRKPEDDPLLDDFTRGSAAGDETSDIELTVVGLRPGSYHLTTHHYNAREGTKRGTVDLILEDAEGRRTVAENVDQNHRKQATGIRSNVRVGQDERLTLTVDSPGNQGEVAILNGFVLERSDGGDLRVDFGNAEKPGTHRYAGNPLPEGFDPFSQPQVMRPPKASRRYNTPFATSSGGEVNVVVDGAFVYRNHSTADNAGGLSDGWGYNYVGYIDYDMAVERPVYSEQIRRTLGNLKRTVYYRHGVGGGLGGDTGADSAEGAMYLLNYHPNVNGWRWVDHVMQRAIIKTDQPLSEADLWGANKWEANQVRTVLIYATFQTRGVLARPWRRNLQLGAHPTGVNGLAVVVKSENDWSGRLVFDIPRHRRYLNFRKNWARMNTLPEWYTVRPEGTYRVVDPDNENSNGKTHSGRELHEGLTVSVRGGEQKRLLIKPIDE